MTYHAIRTSDEFHTSLLTEHWDLAASWYAVDRKRHQLDNISALWYHRMLKRELDARRSLETLAGESEPAQECGEDVELPRILDKRRMSLRAFIICMAWSLWRPLVAVGALWRCCGPLFQLMAHWRPFEAFWRPFDAVVGLLTLPLTF